MVTKGIKPERTRWAAYLLLAAVVCFLAGWTFANSVVLLHIDRNVAKIAENYR